MIFPPIVLEDGEVLRADVVANLFRGWEGVGGKLYITDRRIRFESHVFNIQAGSTEIPLDEVVSAEPRNNLWIIPNGLRIKTKEKAYQFVVRKPLELARIIQESLAKRADF